MQVTVKKVIPVIERPDDEPRIEVDVCVGQDGSAHEAFALGTALMALQFIEVGFMSFARFIDKVNDVIGPAVDVTRPHDDL